jgi:hypothetical protein
MLKGILIGILIGIVLGQVGFSGITKVLDKGVEVIKTQSQELSQ